MMFSLISALTTPAALLKPQSPVNVLATAGASLNGPPNGPTVPRPRNSFMAIVGTGHSADIGALAKATGNAREGATLLQIADRGLGAIADALTAMKDLAERASSASAPLSRVQRAILNTQFQDLRAKIDRIAEDTEFNGIKVLKGITTVEESTDTVTQNTSITDLGSKIGIDDGFQKFVIGSGSGKSLDGHRMRIEYDKKTGLFTITNLATNQTAKVAAPAAAPAKGRTTDVDVSDFNLTIQVNSNFNPNKPNHAPPGNQGKNEFAVSVTATTTTTTVVSKNVVRIAFQVGIGTADPDKITIVLPAATIADLESDLAADDISSVSGASLALSHVANAINALKNNRASVDGSAVRFHSAWQNLTSEKNVLTGLRADLLERPATIETADRLASLVAAQFLSRAIPAMAGRASDALRDLLSSASPEPLKPSEAPNRGAAPGPGGIESNKGYSAYQREPQASHDGSYKPIDAAA